MPHRLLLECVALQDWIGLIIKGLWIRSSIRDSKLVDQQLTGYGRICTATDSKLNLSSFTCRERERVCVCEKDSNLHPLLLYFPISHKKFLYRSLRSLPTLPPSFTSGTQPNNALSYPSLPAASKYKCNSLGWTKWRVSSINCVLKGFQRAYITPGLYCIICELFAKRTRSLPHQFFKGSYRVCILLSRSLGPIRCGAVLESLPAPLCLGLRPGPTGQMADHVNRLQRAPSILADLELMACVLHT